MIAAGVGDPGPDRGSRRGSGVLPIWRSKLAFSLGLSVQGTGSLRAECHESIGNSFDEQVRLCFLYHLKGKFEPNKIGR